MKRDLILVAVSMFLWGIGEGLFFFFQPVYLQKLGANPLLIGTILSGFGLAMAVSHIPAGYLSDRLGRKPLMVAAWSIGLLSTGMMALANRLPFFVVGMLIYGVTAFVMSPLNSYLTAARGGLSVGRVLTLISACYNLGAVIGPFLGGQIGDRLGLRQSYYFACGLFLLSTVVMLLISSQPVEHRPTQLKRNGWLRSPGFLVYIPTLALAVFAMYLSQPLTSNYLANQQGLTYAQIGTLYSLAGIGVVVLNLLLGSLQARSGFLIGQIAVGVFSLLLWRGTGLGWFYLAFFLLGGFKTARSLGSAQVRSLVPPAEMGLAYGLAETGNSLAVVLAPLLAGYLYTQNPTWMYLFSAGLVLVSLAVSARFSPHPKPDEAPAAIDLDESPATLSSYDLTIKE